LILDEGRIARELFDELRRAAVAPSLPEALSRREREVLFLVAEGLSNDQIAQRLFLSLSTVKGHNSRIFEKLGVRRRTEAVSEARRRGILRES
jgi:LuxR family maltose regulon positive regulatory protein